MIQCTIQMNGKEKERAHRRIFVNFYGENL